MSPTGAEEALVLRLLDTVLREDLWRWRSAGSTRTDAAGTLWLRAPGSALELAVAPARTSDWSVTRPVLRDGPNELSGLGPTLDRLATLVEAPDAAGFQAWRAECLAALAADEALPRRRALARERAQRAGGDLGPGPYGAAIAMEAAAAHLGHPVYPTSSARPGLTAAELDAFGPETLPCFALRWLSVAREQVRGPLGAHPLPPWWPQSGPGRLLLPVHPLMADRLPGRLGQALLPESALRASPPVVPTLSMRTVTVCADPAYALKLPIPTATLGARNVRSLKASSLADGATAERLLRTLWALDPQAPPMLHADEQSHAHLDSAQADSAQAAVLLRRQPRLPAGAAVYPIAALPARSFAGELVLDQLAARLGVSPAAAFERVCALIFRVAVWHYQRGVALEAHQQNLAAVVMPDGSLSLLLKDDDALRVWPQRTPAPVRALLGDFVDHRILVDSAAALLNLVITISTHLVAGRLAIALGAAGVAAPATLLRIVRDTLTAAVDDAAEPAASELRGAVLDATRWPVKAMVTAGTLLTKDRSGAQDINKFYVDGPNYLRSL